LYILLQLEIFALLAGIIGLFMILALAMHYSLKMEWTGRSEQ
ncbi:MAG: cell envelope integrity protein CreD, partial [Alistipes sp.]|nr:cell envelope integrity protein CreD [Alistipes sp.]